jgi:outer membrane protein
MIAIRLCRFAWAAALGLAALAALRAADAPVEVLESGPPLSLPDAIRLALANNQNIKVEAFAPEIARANVLSALGQFDPALNFDRSRSRGYVFPSVPVPLASETLQSDDYSLSLGGILPTGLTYSVGGSAENANGLFNRQTDNYETFAGVNLAQPLLRGFGFGANLVNVRVARANRAISAWQYRQTLIDTVTNVIIAYNNLVLEHDALRIALRARELADTLLTESRQRLKAGDGAQSDVTAANARVAGLEDSILSAANGVRSVENQLRDLMGETSFPPGRRVFAVQAPIPPEITIDPAADYQTALDNRPDYQAARQGITVNRATTAAARNGLLPQVNLVWSYGYNGLDNNFAASRHMVASEDFPSSSIGLNLSIPITNAAARGRARAARLTLEQSEADLRRLEADIAVNVANAASQIDTTRRRVAADQTAYDLANQALDDEVKKLRAGSPGSSTITVIQQQESLIGAENVLSSAKAAQVQAAALFDQALGATLRRYNIALADIR